MITVQIALFLAMIALTAALVIATLEHRYSEERWGYETKRTAFFSAFQEWSKANDWLGYEEIPHTMYEDLIVRLGLEAPQEKQNAELVALVTDLYNFRKTDYPNDITFDKRVAELLD